MRVLQIIPSLSSGSGGTSRAIILYCRAVCGVMPNSEIHIATTIEGLDDSWKTTLNQRLPSNVHLHWFKHVGKHTNNISLPMIKWLWRNAKTFDVVHIHSLFHPMSSSAAWMARRLRVPYILHPHGTLSPYTFSHRRKMLKKWYFNVVESHCVNRAAAIIFTTQQEYDKANRLGLQIRSSIIPIPFEKDATFQYEAENPQNLSYYQKPYLLFMSRLHPKKGLDLLLPAFEKVWRQRPDVRLLIAGDGSPEYVAQLRKQVNPEIGVVWLGFVEGEAKRHLLANAEFFVLPSYEENFGIVVVEAMAAGLPVIITNEVDLWSEVQHYQAGLVIEPTVDSLVNAMQTLLDNPLRRSEMAEQGPTLVNEWLSPEHGGKLLKELYSEVLLSR